MNNLALWLVIFALFSIAPALCIGFYLWSRILADEKKIESALGGKDDVTRVESFLKDNIAAVGLLKAKQQSIEESVQYLNNKFNSRTRSEALAEKRKEKEEQEKAIIPGTEQQELLEPTEFSPAVPKKVVFRRKLA